MSADLSAVHQTARRPAYWGAALAEERRRERLTVAQQARRLGLDTHGLAVLSLCLLPEARSEGDDLAVVAERVGVTVEALRGVLAAE